MEKKKKQKNKTKHCKTWKMRIHSLGPEIWGETLKNVGYEKFSFQDRKYGKKTKKRGKCEMHTVGPRIWRETLKDVENEKCTLQDLEYRKDH